MRIFNCKLFVHLKIKYNKTHMRILPLNVIISNFTLILEIIIIIIINVKCFFQREKTNSELTLS